MKRERIYKAMFIDDDLKILSMLKLLFELNGFQCSVTSNPDIAVEDAKTFIPDIIISDLEMPGTDGFTLREKILQEPLLQNIPFVFLTSRSDESSTLKGFDLPILDYIPKTISPAVLTKKIQSILSNLEKFQKEIKDDYKAKAFGVENFPAKDTLHFNNFDISWLSLPYDNIPGGDFIDIIYLNETKLIIALADVIGKKWEAWFSSFPFRSYIKNTVFDLLLKNDKIELSAVLNSLNTTFLKDKILIDEPLALTLIMVDAEKDLLEVAGAGSLPLVLISSGNKLTEISSIEFALGMSPKADYISETVSLKDGEQLIAFTDGVIEATNKNKQQLGLTGLKSILNEYDGSKNPEWIEDRIRDYTANIFTDDFTLLEIKKLRTE